jgi:hypothetical protein
MMHSLLPSGSFHLLSEFFGSLYSKPLNGLYRRSVGLMLGL